MAQAFELLPPDQYKGTKTIDFRQVLPTTKGTVLLATSLSNLGEFDKMQISLTQPSAMYDSKGRKLTYKQSSILKDLYESFYGIKLIAEGPGKIFYMVSDNNHIGVMNYSYGRYAILPPFIFPPSNLTVKIRKIWIDPDGDLYIAADTDTLYIYKDATNIMESGSAEKLRLNYDSKFDPDSNIIITKGIKNLKKVFFGKGVMPYSFAYNSDEEAIWVGTNYGLYAYDKATGQVINKIPAGKEGTLTVTDIEWSKTSINTWFSTLEKGMGKCNLFANVPPEYFPYKKIVNSAKTLNPIINFCRKSDNEFFVAPYDSLPAIFNTETGAYQFITDSIFSKTPNTTIDVALAANGSLFIIKGGGLFFTPGEKFNKTFADIRADSNMAHVVIADIQVGGISYSELKNTHNNYEIFKKITLKYYENNIAILFSARNISKKDTILFAYKLEGIDNDWLNAPYSMMDERLNMAQYSNLNPGTYTFRVKVKKGNEDWKKIQAELIIIVQKPFWQTWWFWTSIILVFAVMTSLVLWWRITAVKKRERKRFIYERQIVELEAKALRAQMNPHFIFNCMNSIKSLIQQHEEEKAVTYLTTFSKLIRTLFNNADKKEISLYDEIETCTYYLRLEAMRFDTKFTYTVTIDPNIDLKSVQVPALIIQPFIENAIWHGIVPKGTGGQVSVTVRGKNGQVEIEVDDDGVGREASHQNKSATPVSHQSKGVNLTQSRLELDNLLQQRQASLETIDKKDENGKATGTKIIITIKEEV